MAVGPASGKVEIEFTSGTWTDVTSYVALEQGMTGTFGRPSEYDDVSAGTWQVTLRNDDGRFTPNNPTSTYYPNVVENIRLRVSVTPPSGSTYARFLGYVTSITPTFPDDDGYAGVVRFEAADLLAAANRRSMQSQWVEESCHIARFFGGWCDTYSFAGEGSSPATFQNVGEQGILASALTGTATVIQASTGAGQSSVASVGTAMADAAVTLTPAGIIGPIVQITPSSSPVQSLDVFLSIPTQSQLAAASPTGLALLDFYVGSSELFSIRISRALAGDTYCNLYYWTPGGSAVSLASAPGATSVDTGVWFKMNFQPSGGGTTYFSINDASGVAIIPYDITTITKMFLGGIYNGGVGKQTLCCAVSVAGVSIQGTTNSVPKGYILGTNGTDWDEHRWRELAGYGARLQPWRRIKDFACTSGSATITSAGTANFSSADVGAGIQAANPAGTFPVNATIASVASPISATMSTTALGTSASFDAVIGPIRSGSSGQTDYGVALANCSGDTYGQFLQTFARTLGGAVWVSPTGFLTYITSAAMRSKTPIATVDIENDALSSDLELRRAVDQVPTRVTVTSPIGNAIVNDPIAEAAGYRREVTVDTHCYRTLDLTAIGSYYLAASKALRVSRLTVDLGQSLNNLYASFLGSLQPGVRVRVSNLPTTVFGLSWVDVYVQGWTEHYDHETTTITFDCSPADVPTEAILDDLEYGRFAADGTLTLAAPITSSDTSLSVTPAAGASATTPVMSTSSADYPLDIDLNGERVTLAATPSTSVRTNRCTNPGFSTNTTSWTAAPATYTAAAIATSTAYAQSGTTSGKVTWPTAASGASAAGYVATVTAGATYAFSVYVYVPSGCPDVTLKVLVGSSSISYTGGLQSSTGTNNAWVRLGCQITPSVTSITIGVATAGASTSGQLVYLDSALLEQGFGAINSYFDGDNGGAWTGTAGASTSTQTIQTFTGVTRGVAPTVARAHVGAESVEVWHAASFAL